MFSDKHINNSKLGKLGERLTCEYLLKENWKIIIRNYRRKSDEIDIIAISPDKTLVFCEVKTLRKKSSHFGRFMPEDNLNWKKFRKISRTCNFFALKHPHLIKEERGWRIDLFAVDIDMNNDELLDIRHYKNI